MDMTQAAVFLSGSILTMLGFIVVIIGIIVINNLLHKYWKPVKFFTFTEYPPQYTQTTPTLDKETK
jgi:hypothetical protein